MKIAAIVLAALALQVAGAALPQDANHASHHPAAEKPGVLADGVFTSP